MPCFSGVRVVFFDAAGTLVHLPQGVAFHYREVALRHGWNLPAASLNKAFAAAWKTAPAPALTRTRRPDDDRGWWRALVDVVLDQCGVSRGLEREPLFSELYEEFTKPGVWALYPEVEEVLASLEGRYQLGIISNFDGRLRKVLEHMEIAHRFSHWVISSEVGGDKPHPHIFETALEMAGIGPAEALHVGDDPAADWKGAAAAGFQVFALDRPRNSLRDLLCALPDSAE